MTYQGDIVENGLLYFNFTSRALATGIPIVLSGTPVLSVYKDDDLTQTTTGITLTVSVDGVVGLNNVKIDTSDAFYAIGTDYSIVITAGAVDGNSVVGEVIGSFSIENRFDEVDAVKISGDSAAADNLEATYDGTGYTDDAAPATQLQIGNVASTGAATNTPAVLDVVTVGTEVNTYAVTAALDGIYHEISDVAGQLDFYYEFDAGANGTPTSITFTGRLNSSNDDLDVFAYNFGTTSWEQIGNIPGTNSTSDAPGTFNLLSSHVGSGIDAGKVRVRGFKASGLTSAIMRIDQAFLSFATIYQSVGYAGGAIWVNTVGGESGTVTGINGTADNPALTWADALALSVKTGLERFKVSNGSTITLTANSDNFEIIGQSYNLLLNGQSITGAYVSGATVSGVGTGGSTVFEDCPVGNVTLDPSVMRRCFLSGTITNSGAGDWFINHSMSRVAGAGSPTFDFGPLAGNTNLNMRLWSGGIKLEKMGDTGTDLASIEGFGNVEEGTCTGGAATIRGNFTLSGITNITVSDGARIDITQIENAVWDAALSGHNTAGTSGKYLRQIKEGVVAVEASVNDAGATTTVFITSLTETADSFYSDMSMMFIDGALKGQCKPILSYNGTTKTITLDEALTSAPANGVGFIILCVHVHPVSEIVNSILTTQMAESYAADGVAPTLTQSILLVLQTLTDFSISGTEITVKKLDGAATAAVLTLDDATAPTSSTRTT